MRAVHSCNSWLFIVRGEQKKNFGRLLRSGLGWTLLAHFGRLKIGLAEEELLYVICGAPTTSQGYRINRSRLVTGLVFLAQDRITRTGIMTTKHLGSAHLVVNSHLIRIR